jgi:AcrR family transcriptional regulator
MATEHKPATGPGPMPTPGVPPLGVPTPGGATPGRADARRNRSRILGAAEEVFAARGPAASTEEVARRAGVAVGTVFRHFPTKEALVEAVLVERMRRVVSEAHALAEADDDPAAAFTAFFTMMVERTATKHAFTEALADAGVDPAAVNGAMAQVRGEFHQLVEELLTRAQRVGAVRSDVGVPELTALLVGVARATEHTGGDLGTRARVVAVVLDGLRPAAHR